MALIALVVGWIELPPTRRAESAEALCVSVSLCLCGKKLFSYGRDPRPSPLVRSIEEYFTTEAQRHRGFGSVLTLNADVFVSRLPQPTIDAIRAKINDPDAAPFSGARSAPADFAYAAGVGDDVSGFRVGRDVIDECSPVVVVPQAGGLTEERNGWRLRRK